MAHGGKREGAGRKSKAQLENERLEAVAAADADFLDFQSEATENIFSLANGGEKVIREVWKAAGLCTRTVTKEVKDDQGKAYKVLRVVEPAFPGINADVMVCLSRTVHELPKSLKANQYITDRNLGRPIQRIETVDTEEDLPDELLDGIDEIYGEEVEIDGGEDGASDPATGAQAH